MTDTSSPMEPCAQGEPRYTGFPEAGTLASVYSRGAPARPVRRLYCPACGRETGHRWLEDFHSHDFGRQLEVVECERCGTKRPYPMVSEEDFARYYRDEAIAGAGKYGRWIGKYRYIHDWIANHVELRGRRVLEIGSNSGNLLRYFRDRSECDVLGLELSARCKAYSQEVNEVPVFDRPLHAYPREGGERADLLLMVHTFEHMPRPEALLREAAGVLRPGGHLYLEVPNSRMVDYNLLRGIANPLCMPWHCYLYTLDGLCALLERTGYEIVARRSWSRKEDPGIVSSSLAERWRVACRRRIRFRGAARAAARAGKGIVRLYPVRMMAAYSARLMNRSTTIAVLCRLRNDHEAEGGTAKIS